MSKPTPKPALDQTSPRNLPSDLEELERLRWIAECLTPKGHAEACRRAIAAEAEVSRLRTRQQSDEAQLVWLANWLYQTFGISNNSVIGRDGWPQRLVEVVAKVVEQECGRLRAKLQEEKADGQ